TGAGPLVTVRGLPRHLGRTRNATPRKAARNRGVGHPHLRGDQPRPPASASAHAANTVVVPGAGQTRLTTRRRRAIIGPRARAQLIRTRRPAALHPVLHRRDADAPPGRGLAARHALLLALRDQLDPLPSGQPPTLVLHPGSPFL